MIKLTRLDGEAFIVNAEMIRFVESRPDTYLTLAGGERVIVRETMDVVVARALEYQRTKQMLPPLAGLPASAAATAGRT